jgi:hypothetical protein
LVENENCYLIFAHQSAAGAYSAVYPYLAEQGVPNFWPIDASLTPGEPGFPQTWSGSTPVQNVYRIFGAWIYENYPDVALSVIYANDSYGNDGVAGFRQAAADAGTSLVSDVSIDTGGADFSGQVGEALQADPTAIVLIGNFNDQPKLINSLRDGYGSDIQIFDPGGLSVFAREGLTPGVLDGIVGNTAGNYTEAAVDRPGVAAANQILLSANEFPSYFNLLIGQVPIEHLARALECAGPDLTREGFTQAVDGGCFDGSWTCSVCLGPSIITPADRWALETQQVIEWDDENMTWNILEQLVIAETSEGEGARGNMPDAPCTDEAPCPWEDGCMPDSADRCAWAPAFRD